VLADTGRAMGRLRVEPPPPPGAVSSTGAAPEVRAWVAEVSPVRPEAPQVPLPPEPAMPEPELPAPPVLVMDDDLKPPIARRPALLVLPEPARRVRGPRVVELDVRIDESGAVSDAEWAGGSTDSALVASAVQGALGMSFFPAEQRGRPVAVWVRQRFDFAAARE
jgi:TonB family protein